MSAKTVLVIDYEPNGIKQSTEMLQRAGFRVEVARDGVAGLQAFAKHRPALVLVEAMLPKKHGFEVCQTIKNSPEGGSTAVVITTAIYKGRKYRADAFKTYRCDDYLEKPFTEEQLVEVCRRLVPQEVGVGVAVGVAVTASAPIAVPPAVPPTVQRTPAPPKAAAAILDDMTEDEIEGRLDALLKDPSDHGPDAVGDLPAVEPMPKTKPPLPSVEVPETDPLSWEALGSASSAFDLPDGDFVAAPVLEPLPAPAPVPAPVPAPAPAVASAPAPKAVTKPPRPRPEPAEAPSRPATIVPSPSARSAAPRWVFAVAAVALAIAGGAAYWVRSGKEPAAESPAFTRSNPAPEPAATTPALPAPDTTAGETPTLDASTASVGSAPATVRLAEPAVTVPAPPKPAPLEPALASAKTADSVAIAPPRTKAPEVATPPSAPAASPAPAPQVALPETVAEAVDEGVATAEAAPLAESKEPAPPAATATAGDLVAFESVDTPPVEVSRPNPPYPAFARQMRQQGTVTMQVLIDENGIVTDARLVKGIPGSTLNDSALQTVRTWTYRPATKDGVPVKVWKTVSMAFRL